MKVTVTREGVYLEIVAHGHPREILSEPNRGAGVVAPTGGMLALANIEEGPRQPQHRQLARVLLTSLRTSRTHCGATDTKDSI